MRVSASIQWMSLALLTALVVVAGGPLAAQTTESVEAVVNDYSDPDTWLCRPGRDDECAVDLATTVVEANGTLTREEFSPATDPPIDCFYVYPTVSNDPTGNSDMERGP